MKARLLVPAMRVPLTSAWDGSTATIADDPATPGGIVVTRGRLRQALPPLPRSVAQSDYSSERHQSAKRRIPSCIVTFGA